MQLHYTRDIQMRSHNIDIHVHVYVHTHLQPWGHTHGLTEVKSRHMVIG